MNKPERLLSLDVFRGLTIAAMILVNQPGSWSYKYDQMRHAAWNGCTITDLIFPFFLIIVGVAMWYAFQKAGQKLSGPLTKKILRRTLLIFLIGLALNFFKQWMKTGGIDLSMLRISGVLQRIALCYGIGSFLCLSLKPKHLFITSVGILAGYWLVLWCFGGSDPYTAENTVVGKIDIALLGANHLRPGYPVDAAGLFGSIPAIVHVLWGYLLGRMVYKANNRKELVLNLFLLGFPAILLARIWGYAFPINKTLWTGSYVLLTTGWALIVLAFLIWIIDIKQKKRWTVPLMAFGVNPLFAYVFSELWASLISTVIKVPRGGELISLRSGLCEGVCVPIAGNLNGSLLYSLLIMVFYWTILWVLYKKKIFIRI